MANGEYAEMIELPVSTCEMVVEPKRKRKFFKGRLIKTVNKKAETNLKKESLAANDAESESNTLPEEIVVSGGGNGKKRKSLGGGFKFSLVTAEVIAIFALVVAILMTNIFWEDSGINTMIKSVFGESKQVSTDTRTAKEFAVNAPSATANVTVEEGVMTFGNSSAVYAPVGGKVVSITQTDGAYTLTISHSDVFKTVISGAEAVYVADGDAVYANIPVAYAKAGTCVAMYNDNALVKDYAIDNGKIVWIS